MTLKKCGLGFRLRLFFLLNVDGRFAQNIEYLFYAQYIADIKQIESDATLAIMLS